MSLHPLPPALHAASAALLALLRASPSTLFLSGAGCSTLSGIPDYRSPNRPPYKPLQHQEFMASPLVRQRYWARSFLGWPRFRAARPNPAHLALSALARASLCAQLITQNVDRLHAAAGHAPAPLELHGALATATCQGCGAGGQCRDALQAAMARANAGWLAALGGGPDGGAAARPDGDAELPAAAVASFTPPACASCGAPLLKPDVTFHGGTVPEAVVERSLALAGAADACVVVGSTVATFSAFRLVRAVKARGGRVAVVTMGATRADPLADLKLELEVGAVLGGVAQLHGAA